MPIICAKIAKKLAKTKSEVVRKRGGCLDILIHMNVSNLSAHVEKVSC